MKRVPAVIAPKGGLFMVAVIPLGANNRHLPIGWASVEGVVTSEFSCWMSERIATDVASYLNTDTGGDQVAVTVEIFG
jgi:hypothetical protein